MDYLRKMSIATRIISFITFISILILVSFSFSANKIDNITKEIEVIVNEDITLLSNFQRLTIYHLELSVISEQIISSIERIKSGGQVRLSIVSHHRKFNKISADMRNIFIDLESSKLLKNQNKDLKDLDYENISNQLSEIVTYHNIFKNSLNELFSRRDNVDDMEFNLFKIEIQNIEELLDKQLTTILFSISETTKTAAERALEDEKEASVWMYSLAFTGLAICLLFGFFLLRSVTTPIKGFIKAVEDLKKPETLDQITLPKHSPREMEHLSYAFEEYLDIRKQGETDLKHAKKLAEDRLQELEFTQKSLIESEKMASLGGLVAGVAHEINTPVGVAVTAASHLSAQTQQTTKSYEDEDLSEEEFDAFLQNTIQASQMILSNLSRADQLIKSFKQVAVDQTADEIRLINLDHYMDELITSISPKMKNKNIQIEKVIPANIDLELNAGALSKILTNLIFNSMIHAFSEEEGGHIEIRAIKNRKNISIIYEDNGNGMDEITAKKIFEPFFTTKRSEGGSGLGMHIVFNLVTQNLKGKISCISHLGEGTHFEIVLPLSIKGEGYATVA